MSGTSPLSSRNATNSLKSISACGICRSSLYCNLYSLDPVIKKFLENRLCATFQRRRSATASWRSRGVTLNLGQGTSTTPAMRLLRVVASKSPLRLRDFLILRMVTREFNCLGLCREFVEHTGQLAGHHCILLCLNHLSLLINVDRRNGRKGMRHDFLNANVPYAQQ